MAADPHVTEAELQNNKIVLTALVDGFDPGEAVEISGQATQYQATQNNAVLATFYAIKKVPEPTQKVPGPDSSKHSYLEVTADLGDTKFEAEEDVTVVARVAKVWVTVLEPNSPDPEHLEPNSPDPEHVAWKEKTYSS